MKIWRFGYFGDFENLDKIGDFRDFKFLHPKIPKSLNPKSPNP